jgi:hypothetical protein
MADVRVIGPMDRDCALMVHTTGNSYVVTQGGTIRCTSGATTLNEGMYRVGDMVELHPRQQCKNRCINIGNKSMRVSTRKVDEQPATHPRDISDITAPKFEDQPMLRGDNTHKLNKIMHDSLKKDMLISKGLIQDIQNDIAGDTHSIIQNYGAPVGAAVLTIVLAVSLAMLCLCLRCKLKCKKRGQHMTGRPSTPPAPTPAPRGCAPAINPVNTLTVQSTVCLMIQSI